MRGLLRGPALLALPALAGLALLIALPAVIAVLMAFTHYDGINAPRFAGGANFDALRIDPMFALALDNTLIVALWAVPLRIALALGLVLLFEKLRRGAHWARAATFVPTLVPDMAWALVWLWLLNPLYGPMAALLSALGYPLDRVLALPWGGRAAIVLILLLLIGELIVVLAAVRREIPGELYEIARLEGAGAWTTFRRLTLPWLWPAIIFLACRDAALTLQTSFTPSLVVTKGGPSFATTFLPNYAYQNAFEYLRFGYAAAISLSLLALTALFVGVQAWMLRRWALRGY
jgi:multiple sugar transport system permease protein